MCLAALDSGPDCVSSLDNATLTLHQVNHIFASNAVDAVMHFAAVAYVGESMEEPLR